jgi:putative transposase
LASQRVPAVLEMEIAASWPSARTFDLQDLIVEMATNNPTWGEERIANELLLKIGIQISPRTVRRYMPKNPKRVDPSQRWMTFVRNHAKAVIACDFFVVVTATFQLVYAFVMMEVETRRILHLYLFTGPEHIKLDKRLGLG